MTATPPASLASLVSLDWLTPTGNSQDLGRLILLNVISEKVSL